MPQACIAIGSNVGDRAAHVRDAKTKLIALPQTALLSFSVVREYPPVDCPPGSGPFLNAAAVLNTQLSPLDLHAHLQRIETELGRTSGGGRNEPRVIDLDLLLYEDRIMATPDLDIPHPRMTTRRFVLEPLAEVAPNTVHPKAKKTVRDLLADLG